jgi:hypothetical protein
LNGGNPDRLTMRGFIDVAYTMLVEEYQRLGIDLVSAIEKVSDLGMSQREIQERKTPPPDRVDNDQSMKMLTAMMAGVKGAPV